jgi:hypothetical protein
MKKNQRRFTQATCLSIAIAVVFRPGVPQLAYADDFWKEAKDYSASLAAAAESAALTALAAAKVVLDARTRDLNAAKALLDEARDLAQSAQASEIVVACEAELAAATLAYAAAQKAAIAAAAIAAGIAAGTIIGEAADWLISRCWDPTCPVQSLDPRYVRITDAEVDAMIPSILARAGLTELAASRADFDLADEAVAGSGSAAWNFIHSGIFTLATGIKGAASYSARLCPDVLTAASDLQSALGQYSTDITSFSSFVSTMRIYANDPRPSLASARTRTLELQAFLAAYPTDFSSPQRMSDIIDQTLQALDGSRVAIDQLTDPDGNPRSLDCAYGFFPALTLDRFCQFLGDCASEGIACLPPGEVGVTDSVFFTVGATFGKQPSVGQEIADYVALGDTGQESELFGDGPLRLSQVLQTAVPHHWQRIDLTTSPLVQTCSTSGDVR